MRSNPPARPLRATLAFILAFACFAPPLAALTWYGGDDAPTSISQYRLSVGVPPVAGVVEQIAGDRATIFVVLGPGQNPHSFQPTPQLVAPVDGSIRFLHVGLPFERAIAQWLVGGWCIPFDLSAAGRQLVTREDGASTGTRIALPLSEPADHDGHDSAASLPHSAQPAHAPDESAHSHDDSIDPHLWLSPAGLRLLADATADRLATDDPEARDDYESRRLAFHSRLDEVDARIRARLAPYRGRTFYVFHPAYGHFAEAYGLRQQAIEQGGKAPTPRALRRLIAEARDQQVHTIFIQPQFDRRNAQALADAIDARIVELDPLPRDPIAGLEALAEAIAASFESTVEAAP